MKSTSDKDQIEQNLKDVVEEWYTAVGVTLGNQSLMGNILRADFYEEVKKNKPKALAIKEYIDDITEKVGAIIKEAVTALGEERVEEIISGVKSEADKEFSDKADEYDAYNKTKPKEKPFKSRLDELYEWLETKGAEYVESKNETQVKNPFAGLKEGEGKSVEPKPQKSGIENLSPQSSIEEQTSIAQLKSERPASALSTASTIADERKEEKVTLKEFLKNKSDKYNGGADRHQDDKDKTRFKYYDKKLEGLKAFKKRIKEEGLDLNKEMTRGELNKMLHDIQKKSEMGRG